MSINNVCVGNVNEEIKTLSRFRILLGHWKIKEIVNYFVVVKNTDILSLEYGMVYTNTFVSIGTSITIHFTVYLVTMKHILTKNTVVHVVKKKPEYSIYFKCITLFIIDII